MWEIHIFFFFTSLSKLYQITDPWKMWNICCFVTIMFSLSWLCSVLIYQEPEPLFKAYVDNLVEELHIQKLLEPHLTEKKWIPEPSERDQSQLFRLKHQVVWTVKLLQVVLGVNKFLKLFQDWLYTQENSYFHLGVSQRWTQMTRLCWNNDNLYLIEFNIHTLSKMFEDEGRHLHQCKYSWTICDMRPMYRICNKNKRFMFFLKVFLFICSSIIMKSVH